MAAPKDIDQQESLEALQKELDANPFNTEHLSKLAEAYANKGDYNNACQLYEKLVRLDEDNGRAWTALGHCYLLKAEYQKCFTAYQKALYTLPHTRDPQLWYGIALLYNKFDTYEYAEPAYQAVLRIDPAFEQKNEVFFKLGQIYKKTGAYDNAISYLRNSMIEESVPLNRKVDALCSIGTCLEKQGKLAEALDTYKEALDLEQGNFKTMEYMAWAQVQAGSLDEAVETLVKALEAVGNSAAEEGDLHYLLGRCHLLQKKFPEGQTEFQKAIFKNPNSYIYWCSIGVLYAKASQPQDAFECFIKASNITQEESESWFNMGILYENCNQQLEAVLAYQRAMTIDPKNTDAAKRKDELQDRNRPPPPEYVHPKFEIGDLPFSLQKSEKAKKASQLSVIDHNKPGELVATAATVAQQSEPATSSPAPVQPSLQPRAAQPPQPTATQAPPQRTPEPAPKPEPAPAPVFSPAAPPPSFTPDTQPPVSMAETATQSLPSSLPGQVGIPMQAQFTQQMMKSAMNPAINPQQAMAQFQMGASMPGGMQGMNPASMSAAMMTNGMQPGMNPGFPAGMSPAMAAQMQSAMNAIMNPAMAGMGQSGVANGMGGGQMSPAMVAAMTSANLNPGLAPTSMNPAMMGSTGMNPSMGPAGMNQAMGQSGMNPSMGSPGMNPSMSSGMNPSMGPAGMNPMALAGIPQSMSMGNPMMSPGGQSGSQMGAPFMGGMGGMGAPPGFNPMGNGGFPGMMNPMSMNPFAAMNPMMMSQMMQMMYMQQMAMMRSMLGMGRSAPAKTEAAEPTTPTESVETRSSQKRKGDALPDTRTKRR